MQQNYVVSAASQRDLEAEVQRAQAYAAQGRHADAATCWREVIRQRPDLAAAHNNLGATLQLLQQDEDAAACFRAALRLDPAYAEACNNLGVTLCLLDQPEEGTALLRRAVALRPGYARAHYNLGKSMREQGEVDAAADCFRTALHYAPDLAEAHLNLACVRLLDGRMPEGWADYEWRQRIPGAAAPPTAAPVWRGEPIGDRIVLLYAEEGFGDTIQFCRYVPLLAPVMRLVLRVPRPLLRLLRGLADGVTLVADGDPLPPCDLQCGLMSLPGIFATSLATIPAVSPYLRADAEQVAYWRTRLADLPGLRVGLTWSGNPNFNADRRRSIAPERLAALADVPGISFVSLQVGGAKPPTQFDIHDPTDVLHDFADTAALIAALDLVIGVDTAVVHLAGALAKPVWLLNRFDTDWRWQRNRADSPWYPTLRQFRQPATGDWDSVLQGVRAALHDLPNRPGTAALAAFETGKAHYLAGRFPESEESFREVLRAWPDHAAGLHYLGLIAQEYRQSEKAIALFSPLVREFPEDAGAINNLGTAFRSNGDFAEAVACYREALRLQPGNAETLCNLAIAQTDAGDIAGAEASCLEALALQPDQAEAHFSLGWAQLISGRLAEGWENFAWRRRLPRYRARSFPGTEWQGEMLCDRTLLLYSDEGFGDAIQCVRYLPLAGVENVVLDVAPEQVRLFRNLPGVAQMVATGDNLPPFDLHRPLLDLPGLLGTTLETIPQQVPYLEADPTLALKWHRRFGALPGFRVGVAWAGSAVNLMDRRRSIALAALAPVFAAFPEATFVSLQKGGGREQIALVQAAACLHDWTGELADFADTAALIEALDLVIAVDTAVAHLAGALGKPVWLLNRFDSDWRWLLGRSDSPWYPTLRQFRQPGAGDWDSVVAEVTLALRQWLQVAA